LIYCLSLHYSQVTPISLNCGGVFYFQFEPAFAFLKLFKVKDKTMTHLEKIKSDWLNWANSCKTNQHDYLFPSEMRELTELDKFKLTGINSKTLFEDIENGRMVYVCQPEIVAHGFVEL
jgi:hypothetical protein